MLAGDLWRYFELDPVGIHRVVGPAALRDPGHLGRAVARPVGADPAAHRLCGWLVEQGRREDAVALMTHVAADPVPLPRTTDAATGAVRLDVPAEVLDVSTVDPAALAVRPYEV